MRALFFREHSTVTACGECQEHYRDECIDALLPLCFNSSGNSIFFLLGCSCYPPSPFSSFGQKARTVTQQLQKKYAYITVEIIFFCHCFCIVFDGFACTVRAPCKVVVCWFALELLFAPFSTHESGPASA